MKSKQRAARSWVRSESQTAIVQRVYHLFRRISRILTKDSGLTALVMNPVTQTVLRDNRSVVQTREQ